MDPWTTYFRKGGISKRKMRRLLEQMKRQQMDPWGHSFGVKRLTLPNGSRVKLRVNLEGMVPQLFAKSSRVLPTAVSEISLVRGLICIPAADSATEGWVGGDPQGTPALAWEDCSDGYLGSGTPPPLRKTIFPSTASGTYEPVSRGKTGPAPNLGLQYRRISWVGPVPDSSDPDVDQADVDVLSWYSAASRYFMVPPQSQWLWYRGRDICAIPNITGCLTFLGAAIGTWNGLEYLVTAVLYGGGTETKLDPLAQNWPEAHATNGGTAVLTCGVAGMSHSHWPIRFYRRLWNDGAQYTHNEEISGTHPDGWELLGEITPFVPVNGTYTRAWTHPRVVASVYFSPDGHSACWSLVDEWQDDSEENIVNFCGYQTADISDNAATLSGEYENAYQGKEVTWNRTDTSCAREDTGQYDCSTVWSCEEPGHVLFDDTIAYLRDIRGDVSGYEYNPDGKIVAVDYDRSGNLITLTLDVFVWQRNGGITTTQINRHVLFDELYECIGEVGGTIGVHRYHSVVGEYLYDNSGNVNQQVNFVMSGGGKTVTIPALRIKNGTYEIIQELRDMWDESAKPDCESTQEGIGCGGTHTNERWKGSRDQAESINVQYLDLRRHFCAFTAYERRYDNHEHRLQLWSNQFDSQTKDCGIPASGEKTLAIDDYEKLHTWVADGGPPQKVVEEMLRDDSSSSPPEIVYPGSLGNEVLSDNLVCPDPGEDYDNSTDGSDVGYPLEGRRGITGLFPVDADQISGGWNFHQVARDYGASDEFNVLTSFAPIVDGLNGSHAWETFAMTEICNWLSGEDFVTYAGLSGETGARANEPGVI